VTPLAQRWANFRELANFAIQMYGLEQRVAVKPPSETGVSRTFGNGNNHNKNGKRGRNGADSSSGGKGSGGNSSKKGKKSPAPFEGPRLSKGAQGACGQEALLPLQEGEASC
jgi:hypothetical protein